jgi:hypothetical protein
MSVDQVDGEKVYRFDLCRLYMNKNFEQRFSYVRTSGEGGEKGLAGRNLAENHRGWTQGRATLSQAPNQGQQALCACAFTPGQEAGAIRPHTGNCAGVLGNWHPHRDCYKGNI